MDIIKIGQFLAELRHEKGLTQEELGQKFGVTNKTVSRWEKGNYMPPVDILQGLSQLYGLTINEILSGHRLEENDYKEAAEANIKSALETSAFSVKEKMTFYKAKWKKDHAFELILEVLIIVIAFAVSAVMKYDWNFLTVLAAIGFYAVKNNQMMNYVEGKVFDTKN